MYLPYRKQEYNGYDMHIFSSLPSTNTFAMELLQEQDIPEFTVYVADNQTAGRGRQGKTWFAKDKANVSMSIVVKPNLSLELAAKLTLVASVAVRRALAKLTGMSPDIKWPNDIFYGTRKICGILTEMQVRDKRAHAGVIGIGVNVNVLPAEFPPDVQKISTSLLAVTGREWDRDEVIHSILDAFTDCYNCFIQEQSFRSLYKEWMEHSYTIGKRVEVMHDRTPIQGVAERLDEDGFLWIRTNTGDVIRITSGEVRMSLY